MGKTGAVLGTSIFNPLQQAFGESHANGTGLQLVLYVCAACALIGAAWTWAFTVETRDHSIEALDAGHRDGEFVKPNDGVSLNSALLMPASINDDDARF
jgi:hypothetical protein